MGANADRTNVPNYWCMAQITPPACCSEQNVEFFKGSRFEGLYSSKIKAEFCETSCQKGQAVENKKLLASGGPSSSKILNRQKGNSSEIFCTRLSKTEKPAFEPNLCNVPGFQGLEGRICTWHFGTMTPGGILVG